MDDGPILIRSYKRVFDVERRIYKIDRFQIPVPGGIELRAVIYFFATLPTIFVLSHLPIVGLPLHLVAAPFKYVIIPIAVAVFGTRVEPDGRPAHRYVVTRIGFFVLNRRRAGIHLAPADGEPIPHRADLHIAAGYDTPDLRRAQINGPATVRFREPVIAERPRRHHQRIRTLTPGKRPGKREEVTDSIALAAGEHLDIRP